LAEATRYKEKHRSFRIWQ